VWKLAGRAGGPRRGWHGWKQAAVDTRRSASKKHQSVRPARKCGTFAPQPDIFSPRSLSTEINIADIVLSVSDPNLALNLHHNNNSVLNINDQAP